MSTESGGQKKNIKTNENYKSGIQHMQSFWLKVLFTSLDDILAVTQVRAKLILILSKLWMKFEPQKPM